MKYSYKWIQKHIDGDLPKPETLKEKIIFHAFEVESIEEVNGDTIFDIKVLPDRAGDCLSHYGMAREIAGLLNLSLKEESFESIEKELTLPIEIQTDKCNRYIAIKIDGVTVGPSPEWLKNAIESIGQRSINNIVDITNYILLDQGQPVHAFDADKIDGGIVVRFAKENENIITLSEEEKKLKPTDMVIADYLGALAIAGVKGGKTAEVSNDTKNIIIEIANFDAVSVRKTSRSLNLITDASKRFENNVSPEIAVRSALMTCALINDIAGGEVTGVKDTYLAPPQEKTITFTLSDITRLLGNSITTDILKEVLTQYGYTFTSDSDTFTLSVPSYRSDITGAHDIAEEVGRVYGYENIEAKALPFTPIVENSDVFIKTNAVRNHLLEQGFSEVLTYAFRKKGEVYVAYGPKDKSALRTNLSEGLKESYEKNKLNASLLGLREVKLFEIGTVFSAQGEEVNVATVDKGTIQELSLEDYIAQYKVDISKNELVTTKTNPRPFKVWSPYPYIVRDIAIWIEDKENRAALEKIVEEFAEKYCVRSPELFDTFEKEGKVSVAYRFVFQSDEKTLTDEEVNKDWQHLIDTLEKHKDRYTIR
jgi:phenylalanyl-tRNA synthetase beta chain